MQARTNFFIKTHEMFLETIHVEIKIFLQIIHEKNKYYENLLLMHKLTNDGWKNLFEWFEKIFDEILKDK